MKIGAIIAKNKEIELNSGRKGMEIEVANIGDRPIQVGSHYHFFEVNRLLAFDRRAAYGYRLDIPSGTSVRFEPGETLKVVLTALGGKQKVYGLNNLTAGALETGRAAAVKTARAKGFIKDELD